MYTKLLTYKYSISPKKRIGLKKKLYLPSATYNDINIGVSVQQTILKQRGYKC